MDFAKISTQILEPDKKLAAIVGDSPRTRGEIIRKFWDYINERGLQDTDRRMINADKDLQLVLGGKKQVNIFQVATLVSKHLKKPKPKIAGAKKPGAKKAKKPAKPAAVKKAPKPSKAVKKPALQKPKEVKAGSKKPIVEKSKPGKAAPPKIAGEKRPAEQAAPEPAEKPTA